MAAEEDIWGLGIEQYSRNFDLRPREILDGEEVPIGLEDIPPLAVLETSLYSYGFDPWNYNNDPTSVSFNRAIQILRSYAARSGLKVFQKYYGFLCVRQLLQITCFAVLREMGGQDVLPDQLRHNKNWNDLARITALQALQMAGEATTNSASLEALYRVFACSTFDLDNPTTEADSSFLVRVLWLDRASFLKLCAEGLLPGCSLLLLALSKLFPVALERDFRQDCLFLQDLSFRHFLVGSNRDRQILQPVSMYIMDKKIEWETGTDHFIDTEDSRRVVQAYSGLLYVSQRDVPSAKVLAVDLMSFIYKFVLFTLGPVNLATPQDLTSFSFTSIEFLWLLVEHRPQISAADQDKLRTHLLYIQSFTAKIEERRILTVEDRRAFGSALGDADFQNLVGRILLIATLEGSELHDIARWEAFLGSILQVTKAVAYASWFTPERIPGAKADWVKVWEQIEVFWGLSLSDGRRAAAVQQRVADMRRAWDMIHLGLDDETGVPYKCAYPRCFRPIATKRLLGARCVCERCGAVTYCDRVCQRA